MQSRPLSAKAQQQMAEQADAYSKADLYIDHAKNKLQSLDQELALAGLDPTQSALLKTHAKSVSLITDLLTSNVRISANTTVLGLHHKEVVSSFALVAKCDSYVDAYNRIYGNCFQTQPDFMQRLTDEKNEIIFLIPRKLFDYQNGATRNEIVWLLNHPQAMRNIRFVLGAFKIYPKKIINHSVTFFPHYCAERILSKLLPLEAPLDRIKTRAESSSI